MSNFKPCDICLECKCKSEHDECECNCEICKLKDECPKRAGLSATIRITTKCTQSCNHCCFSCSPISNDMMTIETAKNIAIFIKNNQSITKINLMGGEIFCNPSYKEILSELIPTVKHTRIVTNSDWVKHDKSFAEFISQFKNIHLALSNDKFHTNRYIEDAQHILTDHNIIYYIDDENIVNDESIVPIGRAKFEYNVYSSFSCYCHKPDRKYSFLIDELGKIYKCGFGVWDYDNIKNHLNGGFNERFKEFNKVFYNTFISNCASCIRGFNYHD